MTAMKTVTWAAVMLLVLVEIALSIKVGGTRPPPTGSGGTEGSTAVTTVDSSSLSIEGGGSNLSAGAILGEAND